MPVADDELAGCGMEELVASVEALVAGALRVDLELRIILELCKTLLVLSICDDISLDVIEGDAMLEVGTRPKLDELVLRPERRDGALETRDDG
jgi:hypothetical protein